MNKVFSKGLGLGLFFGLISALTVSYTIYAYLLASYKTAANEVIDKQET